MASTKVDPAHGQEVAEAEDDGSIFTDSEEEEGELHIGRRDVASDDEGEAEEGEIRGDPAAAGVCLHHVKICVCPLATQRSFQFEDKNLALIKLRGVTCPIKAIKLTLTDTCMPDNLAGH